MKTNTLFFAKRGFYEMLINFFLKKGGLNGLYNGRPGYEHESGKFFLYYNSASQGFWAVGERLGSEVVRLENQAQ